MEEYVWEDDVKIIQPPGDQEGEDTEVRGWSWNEYLSSKCQQKID